MVRVLAAGLTVIVLVSGCMGGGKEDDGTLDPAVLRRAADRVDFQVRAPELGITYRLLTVGTAGGENVNFDVVGADERPLSVDQAGNSGFGVIRTYTKGADVLGSERIGGAEWKVYFQPTVGVVYVHTYEDGVEVAVFGGADRPSLRALADALA